MRKRTDEKQPDALACVRRFDLGGVCPIVGGAFVGHHLDACDDPGWDRTGYGLAEVDQ
jgi:hypothetical protein